jgi:hypothetical protein
MMVGPPGVMNGMLAYPLVTVTDGETEEQPLAPVMVTK